MLLDTQAVQLASDVFHETSTHSQITKYECEHMLWSVRAPPTNIYNISPSANRDRSDFRFLRHFSVSHISKSVRPA